MAKNEDFNGSNAEQGARIYDLKSKTWMSPEILNEPESEETGRGLNALKGVINEIRLWMQTVSVVWFKH